MKKITKTLLLLLIMLVLTSPLLVGCDLAFYGSSKLKTPEISLNEKNKCLTWDAINNADGYDIYCNDELADSIESSEQDIVVYELVGLLGDSGTYVFEVVATSEDFNISDSNSSNSVVFDYTKKEIQNPVTPEEEFDSEVDIKFTISSDGHLSYIPVANAEYKYHMFLYSNTSGLNSYPLTNTTIDLYSNNYMTKSEIYAIRMAYETDGNVKIASDLKYYNPDNFGDYTSNIYLFDGYINDYYIEDIQELKNLVYYSFINRDEEYDLKISSSFKDFVSKSFSGNYIVDIMNEAISHCHKQFYETMSYTANNVNGGFVNQLSNSYEFKVKVSYGQVEQCDITISPNSLSLYSQCKSDAYYVIHDFETIKEKYGNTYDNFVSDKQFLSTTVTTSEQLYWAVENKVTPKFSNTNSRAYKIYAKAKSVLRDIISEDMTDYEKAICIFDWICINTKYDYTKYNVANGYTSIIENYPTLLPCFYLEGVFMTGNSVCDGFSKAYSLMCNMLGIDTIRIVGDAITESGKGGHAWNKVSIDTDLNDTKPAQYYLVDITWTEMISNYGEELTHSYFGLSDEDVKDTHFNYSARKDKFDKYSASNNLRYYVNQVFDYEESSHNLVIDSNEELSDMFDYMLLDCRGAMEVVMDYDYMVAEYEKIHGEGSYKSSNKIDVDYYDEEKQLLKTKYVHATDTMYVYEWQEVIVGWQVEYKSKEYVYHNYELRNTFAQQVMKPNKFQEQYLFLSDNDIEFVYDNEGNLGMLYVLTQNLLIDAEGEIEHLVKALDERDIYGTFTLYVKDSILASGEGATYIQLINDIFSETLASSDIKVSFSIKQTNHKIDENLTASIFTMTVAEKILE